MKALLEDVYVRCIVLSILGWLLNLLKNLNSVVKDSQVHNIEFSYLQYFNLEKFALAINAIMQIMVIVYMPDILAYTGRAWAATIFIGTCAFFGSEFITGVFGSARTLTKLVIDKKTTERDELKDEVGKPTPLK